MCGRYSLALIPKFWTFNFFNLVFSLGFVICLFIKREFLMYFLKQTYSGCLCCCRSKANWANIPHRSSEATALASLRSLHQVLDKISSIKSYQHNMWKSTKKFLYMNLYYILYCRGYTGLRKSALLKLNCVFLPGTLRVWQLQVNPCATGINSWTQPKRQRIQTRPAFRHTG